jgi:large subunit ribosomal protein L18
MKSKIIRNKKGLAMRAKRVREKIKLSPYPRLMVYRSNKYIYAQVVTPDGKTVTGKRGSDALSLGKDMANFLNKIGIKKVVFDRGGYKYHGQVKMLAEATRKGGIEF